MKNLGAVILLFLANTISGIAQGISMIAIPWYFTQQGESNVFGYIYLAITFTALFWSPTAGTFVDRFSRKSIFMVLTVVSGCIVSLVAYAGHSMEHLPLALAGLVFAITFFNYNLHYPTLYSFLQEITEPRLYGRITSAVEVQGQLSSVLAGAGAAMLLEGLPDGKITLFGQLVQLPFSFEAWTLYEIFALDALTYFAAFGFIAFIRYESLTERDQEKGSVWKRLTVGFQWLKEHPYIFLFGVVSFAVFVGVLMTPFYLAAKYVEAHLKMGGDVYAASEIFYASGAILSGLLIRRVFRGMHIIKSIIIMMFLGAALFAVLALSRSALMMYIMFLILGISNAGIRIQRVTFLFRVIPNQVYGRANSILGLSHIIWRVFFLMIFGLPFFHEGNNVIYGFVILSFFITASAGVLVGYYRKLVRL